MLTQRCLIRSSPVLTRVSSLAPSLHMKKSTSLVLSRQFHCQAPRLGRPNYWPPRSKDHKCDQCSRGFYDERALEQHKAACGRKFKFSCEYCDFSHDDLYMYEVHLRVKHPYNPIPE